MDAAVEMSMLRLHLMEIFTLAISSLDMKNTRWEILKRVHLILILRKSLQDVMYIQSHRAVTAGQNSIAAADVMQTIIFITAIFTRHMSFHAR